MPAPWLVEARLAPWQVILMHKHSHELPVCLEMHRAGLLFARWMVFLGYCSDYPELTESMRVGRGTTDTG